MLYLAFDSFLGFHDFKTALYVVRDFSPQIRYFNDVFDGIYPYFFAHKVFLLKYETNYVVASVVLGQIDLHCQNFNAPVSVARSN